MAHPKISFSQDEKAPPNIYQRIEHATDPLETLGVYPDASMFEIKAAYKAAALFLHPDKLSDETLRDIHLRCFLKVQAAYEELLGSPDSNTGTEPAQQDVRLLEYSLHARNWDFKEALKAARAEALKQKKRDDAKKAKLKDQLPDKANADAAYAEWRQREDGAKLKRMLNTEKRKFRSKVRRGKVEVAGPSTTALRDATPDDWEAEESRLAATEAEAPAFKTQQAAPAWRQAKGAASDHRGDAAVTSKKDIAHRHNAALLSGGTSGSVSFAEKKRKDEFRKKRLLLEEEEWKALTGGATVESWMLA